MKAGRDLRALVSGKLAHDPARHVHDNSLMQSLRTQMENAVAGLVQVK